MRRAYPTARRVARAARSSSVRFVNPALRLLRTAQSPHVCVSGQECCDACLEHARKNPNRACNSWVFCPLPVCWGLDTGALAQSESTRVGRVWVLLGPCVTSSTSGLAGWNHTFGECWLKRQEDVNHPLYGQRGEYTADYRRKSCATSSPAPQLRFNGIHTVCSHSRALALQWNPHCVLALTSSLALSLALSLRQTQGRS